MIKLPGKIALIPTRRAIEKYQEIRRKHPQVPDWDSIFINLNVLNKSAGVPIGVPSNNDTQVIVYAKHVTLKLAPSSRGDAWNIIYIGPRSIYDNSNMIRGILTVKAISWDYIPRLKDIRDISTNFADEIRNNWIQLQHESARFRTNTSNTDANRRDKFQLPARHQKFCDNLQELIKAEREISAEKAREIGPMIYSRFVSTAEERRTTHSIYTFSLVRPTHAEKNTHVYLRNDPELRGTITRVEGYDLTVKFTSAINHAQVPPQGEIVCSETSLTANVQHLAVQKLIAEPEMGQRLLASLVDNIFPDSPTDSPPSTLLPEHSLDDAQLTAFRQAVNGPDIFLIQGPPGTGKTYTIVQITRALAAKGERVLITSQTNAAVDNVLERLSEPLLCIRVGNNERIAHGVRDKTVPETTRRLRRQLIQRARLQYHTLTRKAGDTPSNFSIWFAELSDALKKASNAQRDMSTQQQRYSAEQRQVETPFLTALNAARRAFARAEKLDNIWRRRLNGRSKTLSNIEAWQRGAFGFLLQWLYHWLHRRRSQAQQYSTLAINKRNQTEAKLSKILQDIDTALSRSKPLAEIQGQLEHLRERITAAHQVAQQATQELSGIFAVAAIELPPPSPDEDENLQKFHKKAKNFEPLLTARTKLLSDWQIALETPSEDLYHEVIRCADIIGTTCVSVGVKSNFVSEETFDVAIIDEAGQIPTTSALIPMVRARRSIFVGDHLQLPPVVDKPMKDWLERSAKLNVDVSELSNLLKMSLFERLYPKAPDTHRTLLTCQRRMPETIGRFTSTTFYNGRLETDVIRPALTGPLKHPITIVDTRDLPLTERREKVNNSCENSPNKGYINRIEAELIVEIISSPSAREMEWAVIVPYRSQVNVVRNLLRSVYPDDLIRDNVNTVDSFQGSERDLICYGFTRSNPDGDIGFLKELRRLNVAITRARRQLLLVGDFSTLTRARNKAFRHLARSLCEHARQHGEVLPSHEARRRLRRSNRSCDINT